MTKKKSRKILDKIHSPRSLKKILSTQSGAQRHGLVFTNGCFDLIHRGHVRYLESAKALGQLLVVALNSDASVRRLKGDSRPIHSLKDRLEVLAALESVDYVTWFHQDTPLQLIQFFRPKVLVKGGDWNTELIVGSSDVLSWGGAVHALRYLPGKSTTQTIQKIVETQIR